MQADSADVITVSEMRCGESECPDLETLVVLSPAHGPRRLLKIAKPATAITEGDLHEAVANSASRKE
jgi:hypothetical protein